MFEPSPDQSLALVADRRLCRASLSHYASRVPVPGSPAIDADEDAQIPLIETTQAAHHKLILDAMQVCMEADHGRLMIMAPPGSAKSTYASVVAPAWYLGKNPDRRVILASYGDDLARRHGRRTRQLVKSSQSMAILRTGLVDDSRAADEFGLTNGSEYIACGIMGGITGSRAHVVIIDDPVKGREQADSQVIRERTMQAYQDDLLTRLIPGGSVIIINTRWHEDDICGRILPVEWAGESGQIACRDGNTWTVLCLQAECQTETDPMGRKIGEMLWPEWFTGKHWDQFRLNRRTWASLYQQRPAPDDGILFRKADMATYERAPENLRIIGACDYAVTPDGGDWTEFGIMGIAPDGTQYLLDWWRGQVGSEVWIERQIDMIIQHKPLAWFGETGPIRRAIEGRLRQRMIDRSAMVRMEWLPTIGDKATRAQSIISTAGMGRLMWPRAAWVGELQRQCLVFPAGSPDDGVDCLGLLGRGADTLGRSNRPAYDYSKSAAAGGII